VSGETAFLDGGGEMAAAIRDHDWGATPLGPIERWPSALKTAVSMMVNSRFPKSIAWGAELVTIHNDAFRPLLGDKPPALGRSFSEVWSEVWDEIGKKPPSQGRTHSVRTLPLGRMPKDGRGSE